MSLCEDPFCLVFIQLCRSLVLSAFQTEFHVVNVLSRRSSMFETLSSSRTVICIEFVPVSVLLTRGAAACRQVIHDPARRGATSLMSR